LIFHMGEPLTGAFHRHQKFDLVTLTLVFDMLIKLKPWLYLLNGM
jgi:hypothetical protein